MTFDAMGNLFRLMLNRLEGKQVLNITANEELGGVTLIFDNGDKISFGYFFYEAAEDKDGLAARVKQYIEANADFFSFEENDDNDNQRN